MMALLEIKVIFLNVEFKFMVTWAIEAHSEVPPTDFFPNHAQFRRERATFVPSIWVLVLTLPFPLCRLPIFEVLPIFLVLGLRQLCTPNKPTPQTPGRLAYSRLSPHRKSITQML